MDHAVVERVLQAPRPTVWAALMEASNYPRWVVGARAYRGVDDDWPEPGACFHHAVGVWPLHLRDDTALLAREDGARVVLEARARPAGRAEVVLTLEDADGGTRVVMRERVVSGPGRLLPRAVHHALTRRRNREALRRLDRLVSG